MRRTFIDIMQDICNGGSTRSSNQVTITPAYQPQELVKVRNQVENVAAAQVADREAFKKGIQQLAKGTAEAFNEVYQEVDNLQQGQQQISARLDQFQSEQKKINHGHGEYIRQNRDRISALEKRAEAAEKRITALEQENEKLTELCDNLTTAIINSGRQQKALENRVNANTAALKKAVFLK